jgi:hypothetical protein
MHDWVYQAPVSGDLVENCNLQPLSPGGPERAGQALHGAQLAEVIARDGYATVVVMADGMVPSPRKDALRHLLERMNAHLVTGDMERSLPAYTALTHAEVEAAWAAQQADTLVTYQQPLHLITGVLLPVRDRIPDQPQVVRTRRTANACSAAWCAATSWRRR